MDNFTFEDYTEFLNNEKRFIDNLHNSMNTNSLNANTLKSTSVDTVLSFSRSLSVKTSKKLGTVKIMLN